MCISDVGMIFVLFNTNLVMLTNKQIAIMS